MDYTLPLKRHLLCCYIYRTDSLCTTGFRQTICISRLDKQHNTSDHHWLRKCLLLAQSSLHYTCSLRCVLSPAYSTYCEDTVCKVAVLCQTCSFQNHTADMSSMVENSLAAQTLLHHTIETQLYTRLHFHCGSKIPYKHHLWCHLAPVALDWDLELQIQQISSHRHLHHQS